MKQLHIGIPVAASLAAFVLLLLALLAGSRPGFMEEYDIISFNTSALGKNLLDLDNPNEPTPTSSGLCSGLGGFLGRACSSATAAVGSIQSEISGAVNDIGNGIADELADSLGIREFYSLHALTICEGDYTPAATAPGAGRNVTNCHNGFTNGYNVSAFLDHGLQVGRLRITLADLGFTRKLQKTIDKLNSVLRAFTAILIVGVGFTGLSLIASVIAIFLVTRKERGIVLTNLVLAGLALGFLILSGLTGSIAAGVASDDTNEEGGFIGLSVKMGVGYIVLTWVSVGLMFITFGFWLWHWLRRRNGRYGGASGVRKRTRNSEESGRDQPNMRSIGSAGAER